MYNYTNLTYTYGDSNRLIGYGEHLFAYDDRGNPTHYKVSSLDTSPNMTWSRGRQLVEYGDVSYRYDANRIRVAKETDSYRYEYITNGEHNVTAEYHYDKARQEYVRMINYVYNGGTAESMVLSTLTDGVYTTSRYYLVHDVHGNVSRLLNPDGTLCATYHYDSWGKCTVKNAKREIITDVTDVANLNAIRYRGYYYDVETGLYYLQTRYYDPDTGRFVSPDTPDYLDAETTGGLNLYAYCLNDPINYFDPTGHFWRWFTAVLADVVVLAVSITVAVAATAVAGVGVGIMAGVATASVLNNTINEVYYEHISDGESDLTSTSHTTQHVNRWDKLDYTKNQLKGTPSADKYDANAKRYHAEYSFHVDAYFLFDELGIESPIKDSAEKADVYIDRWDGRLKVDLPTLLYMILGF